MSAAQLSIFFALISIPLVAGGGIAIDCNRVVQAETALQDLADRTAITEAAFDGTESERKEAGYTFLDNNQINLPGVSYSSSVEAADTDIAVEINAQVKGTLISVAIVVKSGNEVDGDGGSAGEGRVLVNATARFASGLLHRATPRSGTRPNQH